MSWLLTSTVNAVAYSLTAVFTAVMMLTHPTDVSGSIHLLQALTILTGRFFYKLTGRRLLAGVAKMAASSAPGLCGKQLRLSRVLLVSA